MGQFISLLLDFVLFLNISVPILEGRITHHA